MANLTGIFKTEPDGTQDNSKEKLVDLFRNRAELKKEFAALRDEKYKLQDRLKEHDASAARVQQQMDHIEKLLMDPEWAYSVVAYYQLRRLAARCSDKLANFAEQLKQQREQRAHGQLLAEWNERRAEEASGYESEIGEQRLRAQVLEDRLQAIHQNLDAMNVFVKIFRKRRLQKEIRDIAEQREELQAGEDELLLALDETQRLEPPDPEGLDIASKRMINFMILSFLQQLYLHFSEDELASMAKEATERSVGAVNYGDKDDCDVIAGRIERRLGSLQSVAESAEVLQKRAKLISDQARFRNDDDVVPTDNSVSTLFAINGNDVIREKHLNMLGENLFGVADVLSR